MQVDVRIDRLILDGIALPPGGREQLAAALEAELGRLLAAGGLPDAWGTGGSVPRLAGAPISWNGAAELGRQLASSVYGSLGRQK